MPPKSPEKTILFVDDDLDMLEIGSMMLRKFGYECLTAAGGEEGLNTLLEQKPDLVILDYMMPRINGYDFFKRLKRNPNYKEVSETPVIMLTAAAEEDIKRQELFEMGLDACLLKPFGNRELLNVIDNVFILSDLRLRNKELKERVRRTEYKYQDLIENASDLIFTLDLAGNFLFINRRLHEITGFDRKECVGKSFYDSVITEDGVIAREKIGKTLSGRATIFEVRLRHRAGHCVYLSININPIFEKGQIVGCVGIARDITEKKQLEQQIIELKNFNESIIQSMGSGLITVDLDHKITSFNYSAEEVLGYQSDKAIGTPVEHVFPPEECGALLSNLDAPNSSLLNREMRFKGRNGQPIYIGFSVAPRYDVQSHRVGAIISFKDITQIKQMQAEVQRMDRLASMGVMASGIAHEIRNPLAGIKTIAQTLEDEIDVVDPKREYISRIVRQVNRMDDLLKTFFSYAKPREPKRRLHRLQEIVQEVIALVENRMQKQGVTFEENYHPELVPVHIDFYQIQQVLINLFMNALDAMPDGGILKLNALPEITALKRVDRRGRVFPVENKSALYVKVEVSDTGEGIAPESLASVFNPFFTTKPQGAGLGLSIVYRIIMEHDGEIEAESELNKGTTFMLLLPTEE